MRVAVGIFVAVFAITGSVSGQDMEGLVAYYKFDGDGTDSSGNGRDGTVHGAVTSDGILGGCYEFDGVDDYIQLRVPFAGNQPTFTVELWLQPDTQEHSDTYPFAVVNEGIYSTGIHTNNGRIKYYFSTPEKDQVALAMPRSFETGRWYHVAIVANGHAVKAYADGIDIGTTELGETTFNWTEPSDAFVIIGTAFSRKTGESVPSHCYKGKIDELKIWDCARSQDQIQESIYESMGLATYYKFDGDATDSSGNGRDGTVYGAAVTSEGVLGACCEFDGIDDYVKLPVPFQGDHPTFTVEMWLQPDTQGYSDTYPFSVANGGIYSTGIHTNDGEIKYYFSIPGKDQVGLAMPGSFQPGQWYHVAIVVDGHAVTAYADGVEVATTDLGEITFNWTEPSDAFVILGTAFSWRTGASVPSHSYKGKIDELRIYDHARTQTQIHKSIDEVTNPSAVEEFTQY